LTQVATLAQDLTAAAFVALGVAVAYRWYRDRQRTQRALAAALLALALIAAYAVLALSAVVGLVDTLFFRNAPQLTVTALGIATIAPWVIFVGEPVVRFWLASNGRPAVQRTRLRFLSFGFGLLVAVLIVAVIGGRSLSSPAATVVIQLVALVSVPAIYVSLMPPPLLRRIWRMGEEAGVRAAMQDLLIFSPNRQVMADRAAYWAVRLMGASAGFVTDADGKVMAASGIDARRASAMLGSDSEDVVSVPLHLTEGQGSLTIVGGPFTPVFGTEEISQLRAYASSVAAGIERVRVTERMAALESSKTQFLNLASHELRGPVTVVRGYVSMLDSGMFGQLNEHGRKATGVMAAKISEMNELIEEMIEAARLEDGGVSLRQVETDLRDVAREAAETIAPLVGDRHQLELDLPDRRVRVNADPDRTRTIIANLLSNAIKYSPSGGAVTCQVRARAGTARVVVADEGLGIPHDSLSLLFTRFGRVITPETAHLKGTGLGLYLARQLARLQGGDITVASVEGKGSTFTLMLPLVVPEPARAVQDGAAPDALAQASGSVAQTD
jgi:signal transduction histidine kinase